MIFNTDCFELMRSMQDSSIDLVLTDPSYGTTDLPFDKIKIDWPLWWSEIHRIAKPTAIIACFAARPFTTDLINSNRKNFRYDLVWSKRQPVGFLSANVRPLRAHESILIFFCRRFGRRRVGQSLVMQSVYNPQYTEGAPYTRKASKSKTAHYAGQKGCPEAKNHGRRHPTSVLLHGLERPSPHPTAKPIELCRWLVRTYSHAGDLVFDPFAGAGAAPLAALLEGREIIASELNPEYFATMQRRAEALGLQF